ncbi:MAG: hypothetical protein U0271_40735 [Polyangiaceae bacterium]
MFERFRRDLERLYALDGPESERPTMVERLRVLADSPQIQAIAVYRFGSWINRNVKSTAARVPLKIAYHTLDKLTHAVWGIHIDAGADIGGGLYIGHPGDLLIGPVKMGEDCNVGHHVLIGRRTDGMGKGGLPTIGDRVWIGAGSLLFGQIHVGTGASIGPLTVVGRNVAPHSMVSGNPMQVLRRDWDNSRQIYGASGGVDTPASVPPPPPESPTAGEPSPPIK